jgi:outer membrane protein OmpA-like peptidoglycan-associated protein
MTPIRLATLAVLAAAALAACSSTPPHNTMLDLARSDYSSAQADPQTRTLAPAELKQAADALALAEASLARDDRMAQVDQLAYLARQRVALAGEAADRRASEAVVAEATAARDRMRLAARTREADDATQAAANARRDASASQQQSAAAQQQAATAQQQAAAAQQQAAASRQQAGDAERRSQALEAQLRELDAKKTDRGLVITIGDVLFDTDQSELRAGGRRSIERLGSFLKEYPQRKAMIEGYTDSVGSDSHNQALSGRRADAVRTALVGMGVGGGQLLAQGYGEMHPVAGNDSAGGRQMNRRVEIVLSDENGVITPR